MQRAMVTPSVIMVPLIHLLQFSSLSTACGNADPDYMTVALRHRYRCAGVLGRRRPGDISGLFQILWAIAQSRLQQAVLRIDSSDGACARHPPYQVRRDCAGCCCCQSGACAIRPRLQPPGRFLHNGGRACFAGPEASAVPLPSTRGRKARQAWCSVIGLDDLQAGAVTQPDCSGYPALRPGSGNRMVASPAGSELGRGGAKPGLRC